MELPVIVLPFDSAAVRAADVPIQLTYQFGNEHKPVYPFGRFELEVKRDGMLRLEHQERFAKIQVWTGRAAPEALDRLWVAIKRAGFPPLAMRALPPGRDDSSPFHRNSHRETNRLRGVARSHGFDRLPRCLRYPRCDDRGMRHETTADKPGRQPPVVTSIERLANRARR